MSLLIALPLMLAQVGVDPSRGAIPGIPEELRNRPPRKVPPGADPSPPAIAVCLETAKTDPAKARALAEEWVARTSGAQRAAGQHCLGVAAGNAGDWAGATKAFLAARDGTDKSRFRGRMGALAASALLAQEKFPEALEALDFAKADAGGDAPLGGEIAIERAVALVHLDRPDDAASALADARALAPENPQAWLLSATLSRRNGSLVAAQEQIEKAAALAPRDLDIGLEAGVIAALGGREDAARKSFQSVIDADAASEQAAKARGYLAQLQQ